MSIRNVVLCGVGGQGTVLASKLIAAAAMRKGWNVVSAETIGMAQRGGSVQSTLRYGEERARSPLIGRGQADLLVGFEPGEAVRMLPFLRPDGKVVANRQGVAPTVALLSGARYDAEAMCEHLRRTVGESRLTLCDGEVCRRALGTARVLNIYLLGQAVRSGALGMDAAEVEAAFDGMIKERFLELNRRAFRLGLEG